MDSQCMISMSARSPQAPPCSAFGVRLCAKLAMLRLSLLGAVSRSRRKSTGLSSSRRPTPTWSNNGKRGIL
eukprot:6058025-Pyramimonas_sp.AAC.1